MGQIFDVIRSNKSSYFRKVILYDSKLNLIGDRETDLYGRRRDPSGGGRCRADQIHRSRTEKNEYSENSGLPLYR